MFSKGCKTLSAQTTKSSENIQYTTESSCLPENKDQSTTNKHSSVILSVSTYPISGVAHKLENNCQVSTSVVETTLQLQNSTESCSTSSTPEIFSQPDNIADNSQTSMPNFTYETSLTQSPLMSCPIANNNTVSQEHCTSTMTTSVAQLPYWSLENLQQCFAFPQNEHKSLEFFSISTIGPPPMYEPTLYYEPPDFYEAPPAYTTFSLESLSVEENSHYHISENRQNESISRFRKELIRFVFIVFLVILAMYVAGTAKYK
ncbi:hypothetical protein WA026_001389 [Henosepilachna vigintioctopunctata]|uniref:Uncharacterized protein n=1 Tax=Henosepilachna vigintioctopunctata TaxID=420089 RepID=A0AAW1UI44_9CUCU